MMCSSKKGVSSHQVMRTLDCQYKAPWFMTHRIREAMRPAHPSPQGEGSRTVDGDETFVVRKPGTKAKQGHGHMDAVMSLVERGGRVRSFHVPNVTANNLRPIIGRHVYRDTRFQTDDSPIYTGVGWNFECHGVVNNSAKEYL
jgi:hypothetical protein